MNRLLAAALGVLLVSGLSCDRDPVSPRQIRPTVAQPLFATSITDGDVRITDLGHLGAAPSSAARVTDDGIVVGNSAIPGGSTRGFTWSESATWMTEVGLGEEPIDWTATEAVDLGYHTLGAVRMTSGAWRAAWLHGEMIEWVLLPLLPGATASRSVAWVQSDVVGNSTVGAATRATLWAVGAAAYVPQDLGTLGGASSEARDGNRTRLLVGRSQTADGAWHAFAWENGAMRRLAEPAGGSDESAANAVSDAGLIVGWVGDPGGERAAVWEGSQLRELPTPSGTERAQALGVNVHGDVVGWTAGEGDPPRPALWTRPGGEWVFRELPTLADLHGLPLSGRALDINRYGQVVGESENRDSEVHATRWTLPLAPDALVPLPVFDERYDESSAAAVDPAGVVYGSIDTIDVWGYRDREKRAVAWPASGVVRLRGAENLELRGASSDFEWFVGERFSLMANSGTMPTRVWRRDGTSWDLGASEARAVNRSGVVVGNRRYGAPEANADSTVASVWTEAGGLRLLPYPAEHAARPRCQANDVDDAGTIVGYCSRERGHPMVWSAHDASMTDMTATLGVSSASISRITEAGELIGYATYGGRDGPFRWSPGQGLRMLALPVGGRNAWIRDVNAHGDVVGDVTVDGRSYGVLWPAGVDGVLFLPDGVTSGSAIGDAGHIAAALPRDERGRVRTVRLAPLVPRDGGPPRPNEPPLARAGGPYAAVTGVPVTLDARASSDPDGDALSYQWYFGDGSLGTGAMPTHAYADAGEFTITLQVYDARGLSATATATVTVTQAPGSPVAVVNGPYAGSEGVAVSFSAAGSSDPAGGVLTYLWSFGDGATATGIAPTHVYVNDGTYQVSVRVTNASGVASSRAWTTATIANSAPTVEAFTRDLTGDFRDSLPVERGRTVSVSAGYADAGLFEAMTLRFDWGDGTVAEQAVRGSGASTVSYRGAEHLYASPGRYSVLVTVRDSAGATASDRLVIEVVDDQPPIADPGSTYTAEEGIPVQFDGTGSRDPEGGPLTYAWSFQSGGVRLTGPTPTHVYTDQRSSWGSAYDPDWLYLVVTDQRGLQARARADVFVRNVAPAITLSPSTTTPGVGGLFSLDVTVRDPGVLDSPWDYTVDWGDGTAATTGRFGSSTPVNGVVQQTARLSHTYATVGSYTIVATARDRDGGTGSAQAAVTAVVRSAPTVALSAPSTGVEGTLVAFDGSASRAVDGGPLTYRWEFGDGAVDNTPGTAHAYADQGTYAVKLTVTDVTGLSSTASSTVAVSNKAPTVTIRSPSGTATLVPGQVMTLDAAFSDAGALDGPWGWSVDWGDGSAATTGTAATQSAPVGATHAYAAPGSYTATVTVRDKDEGVGTRTLAVIVLSSGQAPVAVVGGPYAGNEGTSIAFTSAGSSDPDGGTLTYKWDFGDGTTSTSANPTKKYADNGTYTVTLTVTDPSGLSSTGTTTATVANVPPTASLGSASSVTEASPYSLSLSSTSDASSVDKAAGFRYAFDCGDGAGYGAWGAAVSITCPAPPDNVPSTRTLRATIRDKDGGEREYVKSLTVNDAAPVAAPLALVGPLGQGSGASSTDPVRLRSGDALSVTSRFTDVGLLDAPWAIKWVWGDGVSNTSSTTVQGETLAAEHRFVKVGTLKAYLQVTDKDGKYGRSAYLYVRVDSLPVSIDVLPGTAPNVIDLDLAAHTTIQVAILSTPTLDATKLSSLRLGNGSGSEASTSQSSVQRDVDGDGRLDLVAHFARSTLVSNGDLGTSTTQLVLIGTHADGRKVRGVDAVQVVP